LAQSPTFSSFHFKVSAVFYVIFMWVLVEYQLRVVDFPGQDEMVNHVIVCFANAGMVFGL